MKTIYTLCATLGLMTISTCAIADASLVKVGGGARLHASSGGSEAEYVTTSDTTVKSSSDFESTTFASFFAQIQHGLPFVPNYRLSLYSFSPEIEKSSTESSIKDISHEFFYNFSFAIVETQLGASWHSFTLGEGKHSDHSGAGLIANVIIDAPLIPLTPSINVDLGIGEEKASSIGFNLAYTVLPGFRVDLGIKNYGYSYTIDGSSSDTTLNSGKDNYAVSTDENIDYTVSNETFYIGASFNLGL